jgi:hypothetical protein
LNGFFTGIDFHPMYAAPAIVRARHCRLHYQLRRTPNIRPGAVALNKRNNRLVGNTELLIAELNGLAAGGYFYRGNVRHIPLLALRWCTVKILTLLF